MKLLVITQKIDQNDAILGFFIAWLKEFARNVDRVMVITLFKGDYQLPSNVEVYSLGKEKGKGRIGRLLKFRRLIKQLLPEADAVLAHMCPEYIVAVSHLNKKLHKPLYLWYTHKSVSKYLIKAERLVKRIFTASKESCRINLDKIIITGHGIDLEHFQTKEKIIKDYFEIITVGRIAPVKNHEVLLGAISQLSPSAKEKIRVKLIGEPLLKQDLEYLERLKLIIMDLGLTDIIKFTGPVPYQKILPYYQNADLFINLSKTGSLDKAVLEAMACNVPIVTSNEAFKNILPEKCLVKEDDSQDLAKKITEFYQNKPVDNLRSLIEKNHSLINLVSQIVEEIKNYV